MYVDYTRERLVKGLKSFTVESRTAFFDALLAFLGTFPEENIDQLFEVFSKHIYTSVKSSKNVWVNIVF